MKRLLCAMALGAVAASASAATLFDDNMNGSWVNWTAQFDQSGGWAAGRIAITGGKLVFSGNNYDYIASTYDNPRDIEVQADVTVTSLGAGTGGFFTLGLSGSTAGGSRIDLDVFDEGSVLKIGIYDQTASSYGTSAVTLSPQPTVGQTYKLIGTRIGDVFTYKMQTLDGLTVLGTTTSTIVGAFPIGLLYVKNSALNPSFDNVQVKDLNTNAIIFSDDFASSAYADVLKKWFVEPNPDVNEGGAGGMRLWNFASFPAQLNASRPDFQTTGFLTLHGVGYQDGYSRAPTRFATPDYGWFDGVDIALKLRFDVADNPMMSVGLGNRTNEGARPGVVINASTTGQTNGVNNPSLHIANTTNYPGTPGGFVQSVTLSGLWNPSTTPDIYLYIRKAGGSNAVQTWINTAPGGGVLSGSQISGTYTGNASGQIVPTAAVGTNRIDRMTVFDYNTGWLAAGVRDWSIY